ncbi:MAG: hypothetical protein GX945_12010 [Lentisphaerae bacterium]|nr:hypothetical protein [Lentisphaerota bacterium]
MNIHIKAAVDQWLNAFACDQPRGTVIYCYVEPNRDFESVERQISQQLRAAAKDAKVAGVPILVVLLVDDEGKLGQALAEIDVMKDKINPQDAAKFGHLIAAHEDKMLQDLKSRLDTMIKERHYVTAFSEPLMARRLDRVCSEIFARVYPKPVIFPFDGFGTARGNAAKTCLSLTTELMLGRLDWNAVMAKPSKDQNRASTVLKDAWGIYAKNGSVRPRPENPILKSVAEKWEQRLSGADNRLHLGEAIRGLCAPPYGANIASAGLFLGAFLAARTDKVAIVKNDQTIAVSEWLNEGAFKGAFLDLNGLHDVVLFQSGEMSSEWEVLLDEWEQVETYSAQKECFLRAEELKKRIPLPTTLGYKRETLVERLKTAMQQIKVVEDEANKAIRKTEDGLEKQDAGLLSWGLAELVALQEKMKEEKPRWTDAEIDGYTPIILERRQELIEIFPAWLPRQMPPNESPDAVGQFKQKMTHRICLNLEKLNLHDLSEALNKHTMNACRQAELFAAAGQTIREVDLWLTSNQQAFRQVRIAQLRALQKTGPDYAKKLKQFAANVDLPDLPPLRAKLSGFLNAVEAEIDKVSKRANELWQSEIASYDDLEIINNEINELFAIYEGCPDDLEDFQAIRQALRIFMEAYRNLENDLLTPDEYAAHTAKICADVYERLADAELPWDPTETMETFCQWHLAERERKATAWLAELEERTAKLAQLSSAEVNTLHERVTAAPAFLSASGRDRRRAMLAKIEGHLSKLAIEWLVERFRQLSPEQQQVFLAKISEGRR